MSRTYIATLMPLWLFAFPVQAGDCATAFVCDVVNYQRMYLDGRLKKLPEKSFGFQMRGHELVPQQGGSPLGDGTLNYEITKSLLCDADGKLATNGYNQNYQFEGRNGLYTFEYFNGHLLISTHKHHDYYYLTAAECREL